MTTITFSVPNITCEACAKLIKISLNKLPGIKNSSVNIVSKTVIVDFDNKQVSKDKIEQSVQNTL